MSARHLGQRVAAEELAGRAVEHRKACNMLDEVRLAAGRAGEDPLPDEERRPERPTVNVRAPEHAPVLGRDGAHPAQIRRADIEHAVCQNGRRLHPRSPEEVLPQPLAVCEGERKEAAAPVADEDPVPGDERLVLDLRSRVVFPDLLAGGAIEGIDEVIGAAEEDALAGDRRPAAHPAAGREAPPPRSARRVDGVKPAVRRAGIDDAAFENRLRTVPVPVEDRRVSEQARGARIPEVVAPDLLAVWAAEPEEIAVVAGEEHGVRGHQRGAEDRAPGGERPDELSCPGVDRVEDAAGRADVHLALEDRRRGIDLAIETSLPGRRRSGRDVGDRSDSRKLGGALEGRRAVRPGVMSFEPVALEPQRKGKLVDQDLLRLAPHGARRLDGEVVCDRLGQKELERTLGVAPEVEPDLDLLPLRSDGAEPQALDRIAGGSRSVGHEDRQQQREQWSHRGLLVDGEIRRGQASGFGRLDSMLSACHDCAMANLQVKNLPDALHQRLRDYAQKHHRTISDIALKAIEREMARYEWREKLSQRPSTDLGESAASLLEQERQQRESDLA